MQETPNYTITITFLILLFLSPASPGSSEPPYFPLNIHFVLIHGSCHGAWSWYKLMPLLRSSDYNVTAIDLASSGIDPREAKDLKSISDYFGPLKEFMESLNENQKVILVGHSFGGLAISQAMERFPYKISVAVFVTALMPGPSLNISTLNQESFKRQRPLQDSRYTYDNGPTNPPTSFIFGPLYLSSDVYQLSPIEDRTLATMLMRPLPLFSDEDLSRELILSDDKYGSVNRVFIVSEQDRVVQEDLVRWMIERNPPHGIEKIRGSDHMVMMSKPKELSTCLINIAIKYT